MRERGARKFSYLDEVCRLTTDHTVPLLYSERKACHCYLASSSLASSRKINETIENICSKYAAIVPLVPYTRSAERGGFQACARRVWVSTSSPVFLDFTSRPRRRTGCAFQKLIKTSTALSPQRTRNTSKRKITCQQKRCWLVPKADTRVSLPVSLSLPASSQRRLTEFTKPPAR